MPPKPIAPELLALRQRNAVSLWVRWRLRELAQGRSGEDKAFSALIGVAQSQWCRFKSGTPMGHKLARQIERACGQPEGWLDVAHEGADSGAQSPSSVTSAYAPGVDWPESWTTTPQSLAQALGLRVSDLTAGLGLAESATQAGSPACVADERMERIKLGAEWIEPAGSTVLIRVKGESMRDAGILDGNLLVVDPSLTAVHGDVVVARIDESFTVKTLFKQSGLVKLLPANPDFEEIVPQPGQEWSIVGVVRATLRQFR